MKKVLALRHVHFEDLGILEPALRARGFQITYAEAPIADFSAFNVHEFDLLAILGGPIGAFDEADYPFVPAELRFIERRINADKPTLGICLGAQFMARILGAKVYPMGVKEIGFSKLNLSAEGLQSPLNAIEDTPVLHWHGDIFEIPQGAKLLASTDICKNQAFSFGKNILGLQFHMEADPARIEQWLVGHAAELYSARANLHRLRADAAKFGPRLSEAGVAALAAWLNEAGL